MPRVEESRVLVPIALERHMGNPVIRELRETAAQDEDAVNVAVGLINRAPVIDSPRDGSYTQREAITELEAGLLQDIHGVYVKRLNDSVDLVNEVIVEVELFSRAKPDRPQSPVKRPQSPVKRPQRRSKKPLKQAV